MIALALALALAGGLLAAASAALRGRTWRANLLFYVSLIIAGWALVGLLIVGGLALTQLAAASPLMPKEAPVKFLLDRPRVYYVAAGGGAVVKIGTSVDVIARMRRLQRARPAVPLSLLATERGGEQLEQQRHLQFRDLKIAGEWFLVDGALAEHIEVLRARATVVAA